MSRKSEPWYIHAALYVVIFILVYLLIRVAIIEPEQVVQWENYFETESRLRMSNIKEAEILWQKTHNNFTDNLDSLVYFVKYDSTVAQVIAGVDSITGRPTNPFRELLLAFDTPSDERKFLPDSLFLSPKSFQPYILQVDTSLSVDTVINRTGRIVRVDSLIEIGSRYYLECPDGYGSVGSLESDALKNTASWE